MSEKSIFWFRRDLRLDDNAGLYHALKSGKAVIPIFIFDTNILDELKDKRDARVHFIHDSLKAIDEQLVNLGSGLQVYYGKPLEIWQQIIDDHSISDVHANRDYEPYARERDSELEKLLTSYDITFHTYKDHVIFEKDEIVKDDGEPYGVFTPYKRKWLAKIEEGRNGNGESFYYKSYPTADFHDHFDQSLVSKMLSLEDIGFKPATIDIPNDQVSQKLVKEYAEKRNFPTVEGTSRLGIHFRFGTISIREKARKASRLSDVFLSELIWRDFYAMILYHHPRVVDQAYSIKYDNIQWRDDDEQFKAWCDGKTGYLLVDAGMRELNATGFMHNRVRMLVASFLTKHLLIDWRKGEAYFAQKLLDFDLASNNGGWQWAAGCGTDAAPYFRIFSPMAQLDKFDKKHKYVKKWIQEYGTNEYPKPIVDHKEARDRCLNIYKSAIN